MKGIKNHGVYFACERCIVKSKNVNNRVVYHAVNCALRTTEGFRSLDNPQHHTETSPLLNINPKINMIFQFPLDTMQLAYAEVTKYLLSYYWVPDKNIDKLTKEHIIRLNQRLLNLTGYIPKEFQAGTK